LVKEHGRINEKYKIMKRIEGKVVVVTGGALGTGRDTCLLLAKEGAKVAITEILDDKGQELSKEITKTGGVAKFWHLEVSDKKKLKKHT
jgi:NAD(P)-dependent dehydrogenase (short-subunit alcohol dehydrogenase family)